MAPIEHSRLSRRTVLTGAAAMLAAGAAAPPARAAAEDPAPQIRSAAVFGGGLVALTAGGGGAQYAVRRLDVDAGRRVSLGERLAVEIPAGFHPHSMAARDGTLWITGAVDEPFKTVTGDDGDIEVHRARPALLRADGERAAFAAIPVPGQVRSGVATALVLPGADGVAVAVEGCPDAGLAMITRSHLVFSPDGGATWRHGPIAEGLGEGYGTVLAAVGERILAVTGDGAGTQTAYAGAGTALELVATEQGAGRPMAAIPAADGEVSVFSHRDGRVRESRFAEGGRSGESSDAECACGGEVVAIHGRLGAWLEIDDGAVRAQGL